MSSLSDPLQCFRWKNRLLVICASTIVDAQLARQRDIVRGEQNGFTERKLLPIEATGSSVQSKAVRRRLGHSGDSFCVYLIGLDGHTALRSEMPVEAAVLFELIDAMPMRQREMRETRP